MKPGKPLERRTPLAARTGLRHTGLPRVARVVVAVVPRPTRAGEFPRAVRRLLWARCEGLCEVCGGPLPEKGWTGQHRRARNMGGSRRRDTASPANGLAVHEVPCHRMIEANPNRALDMGWRVPQFDDPETVPMYLPDGRRVLLTDDGRYVEVPA